MDDGLLFDWFKGKFTGNPVNFPNQSNEILWKIATRTVIICLTSRILMGLIGIRCDFLGFNSKVCMWLLTFWCPNDSDEFRIEKSLVSAMNLGL